MNSNIKDWVGFVALSETGIRLLSIITALDETDFVGPEHYVTPIRFMILKELTIEFKILSDLNYDVIRFELFVPLAGTEGKGSETSSDINNTLFLSGSVFECDST